MFKFEELRIYHESINFTNNIYKLTKNFPKEEIFGLTNQLRRAAVSVALNIAEGSSRTRKDFRRFLDLSRGSCFECVAALTIAKVRSYINDQDFSIQYNHCEKLSKMINALKFSLSTHNP